MNNRFRFTIATVFCIFLIAIILVPSPSKAAASMSIGPYGWWAWWQPNFREWLMGKGEDMELPLKKKFTMESRPLYGCALSFNFSERWSLSNTFVMGFYRAKANYWSYNFLLPSIPVLPSYVSQKIRKIDVDSTLNYTLLKYLKFYVGLKYQNYNYNKVKRLLLVAGGNSSLFSFKKINLDYHGLGLGIGLGFNVNLVDNLYLLANISALYQSPIIYTSGKGFFGWTGITMNIIPTNVPNKILQFNNIGCNATLSLAYYIAPASITIAAGGRYQYLKTMGKDSGGYAFAGESDHFYGATLSVVYTFNLTKDKDDENS